jgi:hypothetical protein
MRLNAAPHISVVRKEEKQQKLQDFILRDLESRAAGLLAAPPSYLLLARSIDSPVSRAILAMGPQAAAHGVRLRAIFTMDEGVGMGAEAISADFVRLIDSRLASDVRLLDAHELLVLGPAAAWIGDCMRRDPAKRDAYEFYSEDSPEAARSAAKSFERLWLSASPLILTRHGPVVPLAPAMVADASQSGSERSSAEVSTRH